MLNPNLAAMPLDNLLADRKTDPGSLVYLSGMKPLEQKENSVEVFWGNPDAIILYREDGLPVVGSCPHGNVGSYPLLPLFNGIPNQVLEKPV